MQFENVGFADLLKIQHFETSFHVPNMYLILLN